MDAKDLKIETALGERNDGNNKYSQSGAALQCNRNKKYQDIGSNPLAKAEVAVRPCAVIGPDRVVPPAPNDAYLKKAPVDLWSCPDNLYPRPPEYCNKQLNNVNPTRNISPRQTFQENMQRIMVPPTYSAVKHADESNLNHVQDRNAALSKNTKQTMAPEAKYCEVPYAVNLLTNEHKNVREPDMCVPSVNSPLVRTAPHGWPPGGALPVPRTYGAHEVYQYPQYPSCAGPRPPTMPMARPHRTFQEDGSYVYPDSYYQDASVRFKPYPTMKERYPQARYDYINNYSNPFNPPPPYASHKYDIPNTRPPHPYPVYPHFKYLDNRVPDPNIEGYQRPNQQINYNMQFRNQVIHPTYAPVLGNTQNKLPSYPQDKSTNKLPLDSSKAYVDYENAKAKYSLPDSYFVSELARVHQIQKPVASLPNYASPGMHPVPMQQYHRKDNMPMKPYEYMPHYRHFEHPIGFNPSVHHPPQFSPSTLAISPTDSNTSNDTTQTQGTSQEDGGYVSQSSTTSARSIENNMNRLHNDYYRRYDYRYRPIVGNSQMMPKSDVTTNNAKENNKIDVRQFLSMWSEGDDDNTNNSNTKEISSLNSYRRQESAKSQDQLYVLGLVNVPSEELAKYEHIQKVSKLPENIKGYNSIELLNQFEEVIESSNMTNYKSSTPKEFMSMKDRKNAIKQIVEVLPRPVSPLDVEAKISQSVIHKEVGCNFEIKPCSPKMLNVEIASPVQNILGERAIEKVSNPLSNKAKTPLSMRIDTNTACNKIQRHENTHSTYENLSCKMVGSPFTSNNMESVKTNYSLQDLETSSGVCLASLPRLDNEIELNFPEVNQQFINANKVSNNLHEKYPEEIKKENIVLSSLDNDKADIESEQCADVSAKDSCTELTKLSQYRKVKVNNLEYQEDESNANAIRTDSVIIENPDNIRKFEENKEKFSFQKPIDEDENTPMNLTSSHLVSESHNTKLETHSTECALDFSLNKSENGLPILNAYDELINSEQKETPLSNIISYLDSDNHVKENKSHTPSEKLLRPSSECAFNESNTESIIVRNNKGMRNEDATLSFDGSNNTSIENLERTDKYSVNQKDTIMIDDNNDVTCGDISVGGNKTSCRDESSSTNVIVKLKKQKNKSKKPKVQNVNQELRTKNIKIEKERLTNSLAEHTKRIHENKNDAVDYKCFVQPSNSTKSVIQNNLTGEHVKIDVVDLVIGKDEYNETTPAINDIPGKQNYNIISESDSVVEKNDIFDDQPNLDFSVNTETDKNHTSLINRAAETDASDIDHEMSDTACFVGAKDEVFDSNAGMNQINKYYNELISESELFVSNPACIDSVNQSPNISHINQKNASDDIHVLDNASEVNVLNCMKQKSDVKSYKINDKEEISEVLELNVSSATNKDIKCNKESDVFGNKQSNTVDEVLNTNSLNNKLVTNSFEDIAYESIEEKITESNESMNIKCISDETNMVDIPHIAADKPVDIPEHHFSNAKLVVEKTSSIDSGYFSNKNSCTENDKGVIGFPEKSIDDSVFIEQEPRTTQITASESVVKNSGDCKNLCFPISDESTSIIVSSKLYTPLMIENEILEHPNHKNMMEIQSNTSDSSNIYDNIDANMEKLFAQPNEVVISKTKNVRNMDVNVKNEILNVQTDEDLTTNKKIEIRGCNIDLKAKKENKIPLNPVEITEKAVDEPCAKSFNEVTITHTEVQASLYTTKYAGYHGKELNSPWIQKLMMFNEGITNMPNAENIKSDKVESKSFEELNIKKYDNVHETREITHIDSVLENVDVISPKNPNINNVLKNKNVNDEIVDGASQSVDVEVESPEGPNIDNVSQNENDEIVDSASQSVDVEVESPEGPNIDNVSQNENIDEKFLENPNIDTVIQKFDVEVELLQRPNIDNIIQNENIDVKSLEKSNIDTVLQEFYVEIKSLERTSIDSDIKNEDFDVKSLEKPNIDTIIPKSDVEVKSHEGLIDNVIQNENIHDKSLENPDIDTVTQKIDVEVKSLEGPSIDNVIQNENIDVKSFEKSNIDAVIQKVDIEVISIEEPNIKTIQNEDVDIKLLNETNIKSVVQNENLEIKSHEIPIISHVSRTESVYDYIIEISSEIGSDIIKNNSENSTNEESVCTQSVAMDLKSDAIAIIEKPVEINVDGSCLPDREHKSEFENFNIQNDLIETQEISFNYPNNSVISQITENIFRANDSILEFKCQDNNYKTDTKCEDPKIQYSPVYHRRSLKRSYSDSALNTNVIRDSHSDDSENLQYPWAPKRNRIGEFENFLPNNRRNSVNVEESVSFCILIDDNCIISEDNEEKICIAELQEEYETGIDIENDGDNSLKELDCSNHDTDIDLTNTIILECDEQNPIQDEWVEDITCAEDVFSDEVAENVVISAPSSPTDSASDYEHDELGIYGSNTSHGEKMTEDDAQIVDALYRTPDINTMNKTLLFGDKNVESDNDQENIILETDDWKPSPTTPDYIDPTHASNDFRLETPDNKENVFVKELSPLRRIDDYLDVSSAENEADDHILQNHVPETEKATQDTVYSCESSLDEVFHYKQDESISSTTTPSSSSSPEVSSTTSEEKSSGILLKITNLNGSRVSQLNEIEMNNRPRCKFTEQKEYSTSNLNFPNRPLLTKAAQKYIPPIKESIRDLKVKISLPRQSLLRLKQLKLSRNEPKKVHKPQNVVPRIARKPKPNFDDVLKSIDEIQIKRHKEKNKKIKTAVPKVLIKKHENGSHYASTPKKDTFSPDLTGRKWQPWVFLEKNNFIDKMVIKNKTRAIFSHRKRTYVLAEKFKKYKSVSSAKFVISQPKTPGQLKCTIRLKHSI